MASLDHTFDLGKDYCLTCTISVSRGPDGSLILSENWRRVWQRGKTCQYDLATRADVEAAKAAPKYTDLRAAAEAMLAAEVEAKHQREAEEAAWEARRQEILNRAEKEGRPCYIRYGRLPKGGRSYNHRDNYYEAGVSVYHGYAMPDGYILKLSGTDAVSALFIVHGRTAYEVTGQAVGIGSDGEPLLANARLVKPIKTRDIV
jgi:hypothetical protein